MSTQNTQTIVAYEKHIQQYIDTSPQEVSGLIKDWIDRALSRFPKSAHILELGSAFGRDANYIESLGYKIKRSDVVDGFIKLLQEQGHDVQKINIITDILEEKYDLIFANGVLVHFSQTDAEQALAKIYLGLKDGGIFAFNIKSGFDESWTDKLDTSRYFNYWNAKEIDDMLKKSGFTEIEITDGGKNARGASWLSIIAVKHEKEQV